jgi:Na+/alanine symporter
LETLRNVVFTLKNKIGQTAGANTPITSGISMGVYSSIVHKLKAPHHTAKTDSPELNRITHIQLRGVSSDTISSRHSTCIPNSHQQELLG